MNAVLAMSPGSAGISEHDPLAFLARPGAPESRRPLVDVSADLLRTMADVLDIRGVFPRVSEIVQHVLHHDALELMLCDRSGHVTLEARSTDDLAGLRGCAARDDEAFHIVGDLQWPSARRIGVIERQSITTVLRETDGNKSKTARRLGLTRTQLYVRLRRYGLEHAEAM
jgi:regulatory Fis family protein